MESNFTLESILLRPSVQEYFSHYENHEKLLEDEIRLDTFRKAILKTVKPGDVVMDIGAGTGILSRFALEAGARKVYLVEENENILSYAKKNLLKNDYGAKCIFIANRSNKMKTEFINEKIDVIISETIGSLGVNEGIIETLYDARRFLKTNGIVIPFSISLFYAILDFEVNIPTFEPVILRQQKDLKLKSKPHKLIEIKFDELISNKFDLIAKIENLSDSVTIAIWFEAYLFDDIKISNSPNIGCSTSWGICMFKNDAYNRVNINISNNCGTREFIIFNYNSIIEHKYIQKLIKVY
jgi:predicted RNA methylase